MLEHKKGSIIYMMMILILCSSILVRNYRLFRSHVYLERGIYSMDVRVHDFADELNIMETRLKEQFAGFDDFVAFMKSGRKITIGSFTISYDSSYNKYDVNMIIIVDNRLNYLRKVMVTDDDGHLKLTSKGV